MALRHTVQRFSPTLDGRWVIFLLVVGVLVGIGTFIRWSGLAPPLDLLALGPDGQFQDTLVVPAAWGDTATNTPDAVARIPLILGVRNQGGLAVTPERLSLSLPLRYRLTRQSGQELDGRIEAGSPLIAYTLEPGLGAVLPRRVPVMLPAHDTLWLEVVVPTYYCVALGDSVPEFVPAPPPPLHTMSNVRLFYSFEGGDLKERRTGTLAIHIDSTLLAVERAPDVPSFEMVNDPALAQPDLGPLVEAGSRRSRCGEPGSAMELLSTVYETEAGGRVIALDYGGKVRKNLYDLDDDGVIERESWSTGASRAFTATRRTALPIPAFLLPLAPSGAYDLARIDSLPPDSVARLDPFRRAMEGPGAIPGAVTGPRGQGMLTAADSLLRPRMPPLVGATADTVAPEEAAPEPAPAPAPRRSGPLGRPVDDGG